MGKTIAGRHKPSDDVVATLEQHIAAAFRRAKRKRSYNQLEAETGIDRRKLTALAKLDKLGALSAKDLLALNSLMDGALVSALQELKATSMVHTVAEAHTISFILGAREVEKTDHVSRWDVRAMTFLLRSIQQHCVTPPDVSVDDVLRVRPSTCSSGLNMARYDAKIHKERWFQLLQERAARAVIVLGSPRSCHPCEHVLGMMFGHSPYTQPNGPLPFKFVWSPELHASVPSTFAVVGAEPRPTSTGTVRSEILGVELEGERHAISPREPSWSTYGFCAAQRRKTGQTWIVIAGATGPATLATAEALLDVKEALPPPSFEADGAPIWFAVEATVECEEDRPGDNRVLTSKRVIQRAVAWNPSKQQSTAKRVSQR